MQCAVRGSELNPICFYFFQDLQQQLQTAKRRQQHVVDRHVAGASEQSQVKIQEQEAVSMICRNIANSLDWLILSISMLWGIFAVGQISILDPSL